MLKKCHETMQKDKATGIDSKAVHLLQAGVNLIYIRDFLGHSDIKTTEIYVSIYG